MDDDLSDHLDPELDDAVTESGGGSLPGPISLPRVVMGLHLFTAAIILPLAFAAASRGAVREFAVFVGMIVALVATGVVVARLTARRY